MVRVQHLWLTWLLQDSVVPRLLCAEGSALCKKRWLRPQPLTAGLPVEFGAEVQRWGERQLFRWSQVWLFVHQHHSHIRSAPLSLSALTFFHCFIQSSAPHFYSTIFPLPQYPLLFSSPPVSRPVCSFLPPRLLHPSFAWWQRLLALLVSVQGSSATRCAYLFILLSFSGYVCTLYLNMKCIKHHMCRRWQCRQPSASWQDGAELHPC